MSETSDKKAFAEKAYDFVKSHWGEIFTLGHIASGFMQGRVSDNAPDAAKATFEAIAGNFGGRDNPLDEITFKRLVRRLTKQQREFLLEWIGYEFPIDNDDPWVRNKARDALEDFRVLICAMVKPAVTGERTKKKPLTDKAGKVIKGGFEEEKESYTISPADDSDAFAYLQGLAKDINSTFNAEAKKLGKKVSELSDDEREACKQKAFAKITQAMQRQGSPRAPTADEKTFTRQARQIFTSIGPKSSKATKSAWKAVKEVGKKADRTAREARAAAYLAERRNHNTRGRLGRLRDRIIRIL